MTMNRRWHVATCVLCSCIGLPAEAQYQHVIDAWVAQDARNPPEEDSVLFLGSSTIRFWESLTRDFADYRVIQRGFGSARLPYLIQYIDEVVIRHDPAAIVMFSSPPNGTTNEDGLAQYSEFVAEVRARQRQDRPPDTNHDSEPISSAGYLEYAMAPGS